MPPIDLSLVFHNHQPAGQFDFINEYCVNRAYRPLIELMGRHPGVKCGIHFTGSLLDYLVAHQVPLLERVRDLVQNGQLEVLTGGYYEPVLVALSDADKLGQIHKLNETIKDLFGVQPRGLWLAERVWEPHLAKPIAQAGIEYVIIDDTHFEAVGMDKDRDLFGYYVTEENGHALRVFPSLRHLRYAIPWDTVEEILNWLRQEAETGQSTRPKLALMAEDGEKFGVWPGTYDISWGSGSFMERFFNALEAESGWLHTIRPSDYIDQHPALGRAYLPASSYFEMGQWSLPPASARELTRIRKEVDRRDVLRHLHGGMWRNFMAKYDEVNHMHKRMLMVSEKVHAMPGGPDKTRALDLLWRAQANDAYWHGLFGGVYLFNFRVANYAHLIEAEELAEGPHIPLSARTFDFSRDGGQEIVMSGSPFNAIWKPAAGGMMLELDHRTQRYNLLNIMTRREEAYHDDIRQAAAGGRLITPETTPRPASDGENERIRAKERGIESALIYDWHRRGAYIDHFLSSSTYIGDLYRAAYGELGDFVNQPYQSSFAGDGATLTIRLWRDGHVWSGKDHSPVRVQKTFTFRQGEDQFQCAYTVTNQSDYPLDLRFAVELAAGFDGGQVLKYCHYTVNGTGLKSLAEVLQTHQVRQHTSYSALRGLSLITEIDQPCTLWTFPLDTVTNSEAGYERNYQGTVFIHVWNLHLPPGADWNSILMQRVNAYNK